MLYSSIIVSGDVKQLLYKHSCFSAAEPKLSFTCFFQMVLS